MFTAGSSYSLVSSFVHMKATTTVATTRPEVGVLVDAPAGELPTLAGSLLSDGMRASFTVGGAGASPAGELGGGDQAMPRLPTGGLVRWLQTGRQLHRLGYGHGHFLYASNGPSVGQWWLAHGAGGRLVAGAVKLNQPGQTIGNLHAGEVIEVRIADVADGQAMLSELEQQLDAQHLNAVPVGRLLSDAGVSV